MLLARRIHWNVSCDKRSYEYDEKLGQKMEFKKLEIYIFGCVTLLTHLAINLTSITPIELPALLSIQFFFFTFLLFVKGYMVKKKEKDASRLWVDYIFIVTIKFFIFLVFIYFLKNYFEIKKQEALIHIFLWLFIYLFYEIRFSIHKLQD